MDKIQVVTLVVMVFLVGIMAGAMIIHESMQEDVDVYQAVLHISNWTNRTLDINVWVLGGSQYRELNLTLEHGENATVFVTFVNVKECITFVHCVGEDINNIAAYEVEAGDWQAVVLI